jgi:hypothetical protein
MTSPAAFSKNTLAVLNFDLIIRRLGVTLAITTVLACIVAFFNEDSDMLGLFLPCWATLFFAWPYLSRRLGFDFPKAPKPRQRSRRASAKSLVLSAVLAMVLSVLLALILNIENALIWFIPLWVISYYGWPYLSRRLPFLDFEKGLAGPKPDRPLWLRLIRSTTAAGATILFTIICFLSMTVFVPITLCERRARKVHDYIHAGMTVQEVLDAAKDYDIFWATSDFPYDQKADGDNIPAMGFHWRKDGTYRTYDLAARKDISLTKSETVERLRAKLHDGYQWRFAYTYINVTPMHVSFGVVFGADGRVSEVTPVRGWD